MYYNIFFNTIINIQCILHILPLDLSKTPNDYLHFFLISYQKSQMTITYFYFITQNIKCTNFIFSLVLFKTSNVSLSYLLWSYQKSQMIIQTYFKHLSNFKCIFIIFQLFLLKFSKCIFDTPPLDLSKISSDYSHFSFYLLKSQMYNNTFSFSLINFKCIFS